MQSAASSAPAPALQQGSVPPRPKVDISYLAPSTAPQLPTHLLPFHHDSSQSQTGSEESEPRWLAMGSMPAHAPSSSFRVVINELTRHPERNSSTILRADILHEDKLPAAVGGDKGENAEGWMRERTVLRRLLPGRPKIDWPLVQSCDLWRRTLPVATKLEEEHGEVALVYTPLADDDGEGKAEVEDYSVSPRARARLRPAKEDEVPFYHPKVRAIAFRFIPRSNSAVDGSSAHTDTQEGPFGTIRIDICPFSLPNPTTPTPSPSHPYPPNHRLTRTVLSLLTTLHAHTWGHAHAYVKRVHHDILVPRDLYQDTYLQLKARHAERIVGSGGGLWVEKTDPEKHVFEDLGIAAWLMCLWRGMYPAGTVPVGSSTTTTMMAGTGDDGDRHPPWSKWPRPPGGFVDVGCGNGLLVHLLHLEGYAGFGMDLRERKSWDAWRADALSKSPHNSVPDLRQLSLDLPSLVLDSEDEGEGEGTTTAGTSSLFPPGSFLIGNHSDEISPWLPLLATAAVSQARLSDDVEIQPAFANIACCPFMLDGTRFGAKRYDYGGEEEIRNLLFGSQHVDDGDNSLLVQRTIEALLLGPPVDAPSKSKADTKSSSNNTGSSRNTAYLQYLSHLHLQAGWAIEKEALRIPSTKNWALVGRTRVGVHADVRGRIERMAEMARVGWKARVPEGKAGGGLQGNGH